MAWGEQWSYKVDGVEVNDKVNFFCQIPELDDLDNVNLILAPIAGDYPAVVRAQPSEARITFNIAVRASSNAQLRTRYDTLKGIFTKGATRHQLTVQARGMPSPLSLYFYVEGRVADWDRHLISYRALANRPVLE